MWHSRNEWRLNGVMKYGKDLVFGAMHYWVEFLAANDSDKHLSIVVQKMNWSPPPPGLCKVNVDWKLLSVHLKLNPRHLKQEFCLL